MNNHHQPHQRPSFTRFFMSHVWVVAAVTVLWWVGCGGCGCNGSNGAGDKDSGVDAHIWEDSSTDSSGHDAELDGQVDAGPGSDCTIHTLPHEEIIPGELYRLPPTGEHKVYSMDWNGTQIVYSERRCGNDSREEDVYFFDLEHRTEEAVTEALGSQKGASIKGNGLVYFDFSYVKDGDPENEYRSELIHYNLASATPTRLTDGNWPKIRPAFNGTHVAYLSYEHAPDASEPPDLKLLELASGDEIELADHTQNIQRTYDIAADYVTWQAQPVAEPNVWDIFYHHIPTGITERLQRSTMYLFSSRVSGARLVWNESDGTSYDVWVKQLPAGAPERIVTEEHDQMAANIEGHLVIWFDWRHSGESFPSYSYDLYLHDLETGVSRRLTEQPGGWGGFAPSCRWLLYGQRIADNQAVTYAWDAVAAGVLDADCHVIPCDPQVETCAMIEWRSP